MRGRERPFLNSVTRLNSRRASRGKSNRSSTQARPFEITLVRHSAFEFLAYTGGMPFILPERIKFMLCWSARLQSFDHLDGRSHSFCCCCGLRAGSLTNHKRFSGKVLLERSCEQNYVSPKLFSSRLTCRNTPRRQACLFQPWCAVLNRAL